MPVTFSIPFAFLVLLGFQLLGEIVRSATSLPLPGPVIGMFLLTATLVLRRRDGQETSPIAETGLASVADSLIRNMGLLFVPAGVGIMAETRMLEREWMPILAGVVGSTILGVIATGVVMRRAMRGALRASADGTMPDTEVRTSESNREKS